MAERDGERTRSHAWNESPTTPQVIALWDGGQASKALAPGAALVIGRSDDADLQIVHVSVSRSHARIFAGPPILIEDLGSSNGLRVNGALVRAGERVVVQPGDVIEIGAAMVIVRTPVATAAHDPTPAMERTHKLAALVAKSSLGVLILGETGVGKEVLAREVHEQSYRAKQPFVRINCASLSETLLESELFGHERGAFTGAIAAKPGLFEAAHTGTLFLDEIGEMPLAMQAKVLRVLENGEVRRVGSIETHNVDVRFVAATHRDLRAMASEGLFRTDLYFRINGVTLVIPPLRERAPEILSLARTFIDQASLRDGHAPPELAASARVAITTYAWPGNVRELRTVMERALLLAGGKAIEREHLLLDHEMVASRQETSTRLDDELARVERDRIVDALARSDGNQTEAAKLLGVARRTLIHRIEAYKLPRPRKKT
jgi:two-component system response regulator AtoC